MSSPIDSVVRVVTDDGAFRVIAVSTDHTAREVIEKQSARGKVAEHLGDLVTGAVLIRETMAPQLRLQCILTGANRSGSIVADTHPSGATRGLVQLSEGFTEIDMGEGAQLRVMRSLPNGAVHQGVVDVSDGENISRALMEYMQSSEQVASMLSVATVFDGDQVIVAGGYIVQLLPEVGRDPLKAMADRLVNFERIGPVLRQHHPTPHDLIRMLLQDMPFTQTEERSVRFECQCSQERVVASLSTLPRAELAGLVEAGEALEIDCDYCGKSYSVSVAQLRGILEPS